MLKISNGNDKKKDGDLGGLNDMSNPQSLSPINNDQNNEPQSIDNQSSEFDTNFDAGVDADEQTDPKKYIQQLTGKLSQTLRNYNQNQNDPDLNKYVAGMIATQAANGLADNDKDEIIDKIQNGSGMDNSPQQPQTGNQPDMNDPSVPEMNGTPQMEGKKKHKKAITEKQMMDEILNDILTQDNDKRLNTKYTDKPNRISFKRKPFINPLMR